MKDRSAQYSPKKKRKARGLYKKAILNFEELVGFLYTIQ
jgi:hypothetical protein